MRKGVPHVSPILQDMGKGNLSVTDFDDFPQHLEGI